MKILLPISLDRWRNPISTLLRACVEYNPEIEFHSFSNPETDEDRELGKSFWKLPNLRRRHPVSVMADSFDVIHTASYSRGNHLASLIAKTRGFGRTRVLNTMNLEVKPDDSESWCRYQKMLGYVDRYVAVSRAVATCILPDVGENLMGVIPNGYDADYFDPVNVRSDDLSEKNPIIEEGNFVLCVAAIERRKRYDLILDLAKKHVDLKFVIAGSLIDHSCRDLLRQFNLQSNVFMMGRVSRAKLRALFSRAAALAFPSEREGLPLAVIEAMGMGLPVVCQPKSSLPELVQSDRNGALLDATNLSGWYSALRKYCEMSRVERDSLSQAIREKTRSLYHWEIIGKKYREIYTSIK
jgi:glycosyltransferase involved in cell wall biosynthesis